MFIFERFICTGGEGGDLRQIIAQLEKDKEEEIAEKERLQRELEVMNQRLAIMQRQLDKQQVVFSSSAVVTEIFYLASI